ncbi:MAG: hypothetical protein ACTSRS_12735 [Candidatus Helarchaeota archaeon]
MEDSVHHIAPIKTLEELGSRHTIQQSFTNKEELYSILMRTLVQHDAIIWELPPENKFINQAAEYKLIGQDNVKVPMGDIPIFYNNRLFFLKIILFNRYQYPPTTPQTKLTSRKLTRRQIESLAAGKGLLLLVCEPPLKVPSNIAIEGPEAYKKWYREKFIQDVIPYYVILLNQADFLQYKSRILDNTSYFDKNRKNLSFQKAIDLFPTKLTKFTHREIVEGALASFILNNSAFTAKQMNSIDIEETLETPSSQEKLETPPNHEKLKPSSNQLTQLQPKSRTQLQDVINPDIQGLATLLKFIFSSAAGPQRLWNALLKCPKDSLDNFAKSANLHPKTARKYLMQLVHEDILQEVLIDHQKGYFLAIHSSKIQGIKAALNDLLAQFPPEARVPLKRDESTEQITSFLPNMNINSTFFHIFSNILKNRELPLTELKKLTKLHSKTIRHYLSPLIQQGIINERQTESDKIYYLPSEMTQLQGLWQVLQELLLQLDSQPQIHINKEIEVARHPSEPLPSKPQQTDFPKEPYVERVTPTIEYEQEALQISEVEQKVLKILSTKGESSLPELVQQTGLKSNSVEDALRSLTHLGLVQTKNVFFINTDFLVSQLIKTSKSPLSSLRVTTNVVHKANSFLSKPKDILSAQPQPNCIFISTLGYRPQGIFQSVKSVGRSKLLLILDNRKRDTRKIESIFYKHLRKTSVSITQSKFYHVQSMKINEIIKFIRKCIDENYKKGYQVYLNLFEGSQRLTIAVLYAVYREFDKVTGIFYYDSKSDKILKLPVFPWSTSNIPPENPSIRGDLELSPFITHLDSLPSLDLPSPPSLNTNQKTMITTLGRLIQPLINTLKHLQCSKVIILHNNPENQINSVLKKLKQEIIIPIQPISIQSLDINSCISLLHDIIQQEHDAGNAIVLNLSGGIQKLTIAMVLISYLEYNNIFNFYYSPVISTNPIELPRMPWKI